MPQSNPMAIKAAPATASATWSADQIALIKRMVAPGATDDELRLFLYQCARLHLDPLLKQVYFVKRPQQIGTDWVEVGSIQVGIDGMRLAAERTGEYAGQVGPLWCGPDGQWTEVWLGEGPPAAAKVGIWRRSWTEPVWGVARWQTYVQTRRDGLATRSWAKMPDLMLAKVAEALAFRKAFPEALTGVYAAEEAGAYDEAPAIPAAVATPAGLPDRVAAAAAHLALDPAPEASADGPADTPPGHSPPRTLRDYRAAFAAMGVAESEVEEWVTEATGQKPPATWTEADRKKLQRRLERAWRALTPADDPAAEEGPHA